MMAPDRIARFVCAIIDAGLVPDAPVPPYPFPVGGGRVALAAELIAPEILAVVEKLFGRAWVDAIAPQLTVH
jgi:hypothetical protein